MTETNIITHPHDAPQPPRRSRGPLIALGVAAAVLLVVGIFGLFAANQNEAEPAQPEPPTTTTAPEATPMSPAEAELVINDFVAAMRAGDGETAASLVEGATEAGDGFLEWLIALDTSGLEFFDCNYELGSVSCTTTAGPDHFYERIHGEGAQLTFSADVEDGQIANATWRPSNADMRAAAEFRTWAIATYPEFTGVMFDITPIGILTRESGTTMMSLLDEFLVYRAQLAVEALAAALQNRDAVTAELLLAGEPASDGFLYWVTVLDTSGVEFFDCSYEPDFVRCNTTKGPDFWYERIHGANVEVTFTAHVEAGKLAGTQWPAPVEDRLANSDFKAWVAQHHPDLTDVIFDGTPIGRLTREAAEARVELLDEYLASR